MSELIYECFSYRTNPEKIKKLIMSGGDINYRENHNRWSALIHMCVCSNINLGIVELLVENGANTNLQDITGWTALMHACSRSDIDLKVVKLLIDNGADV